MSWKTAALTLLGNFSTITLERTGATPPTLTVRGRVYNYAPDELVGGISQLDRKGIVYADDVTWTPKLRNGDRVRYATEDGSSKLLNVEHVDDATARVAGENLVIYRLRLKGQ
jgi:hypothetical protein